MYHMTGLAIVATCLWALTPFQAAYAEKPLTLVEVGQKVSTRLLEELQSVLMTSMAEHGPAGAIEVCNEQALNVTKEVAREFRGRVSVKRVSSKYRNPKNTPDIYDRQAFKLLTEESKPKFLVFQAPEGQLKRYYKPLYIKPACLACHGPKESIAPEVKKLLRQHYPKDQATGYKVGDFRGAIRVILLPEGSHTN